MKKNNISPRWITVGLCGIAGALAFLLIYGAGPLNPCQDVWLLGGYDEGDITQHYAGWLAFRNPPWAFPLGYAANASIPDGVIISYTDSIPWVAILCKVFRNILPETWQYFGLYTFLCFVLQGIAAGMLVNRFSKSRCFTVISSVFFAFSPILLDRAFRHTALASHWLILFSIYIYLSYRQKLHSQSVSDSSRSALSAGAVRFPWQCFLLNILAIGLHPYMLPITMLFTLLCCVERGGQKTHESKTISWCKAAGFFLLALFSSAFAGWCLGVVGWTSGDSREGFGFYSMNLNAPVNPSSPFGYQWSRFLQPLPQGAGQYEGFNYLGVGILLLVVVCFIWMSFKALRTPEKSLATLKKWMGKNALLLLALLFLFLFALSNTISLGEASLVIPLPKKLLELCGIFRSSGRMFYAVWYLLLLWGLFTLSRLASPRWSTILLALFAAIQLLDLSPVIRQKHDHMKEAMDGAFVPEIFQNENLCTIGETRTKLLLTNNISSRRDLAVLAGKQGMQCNAVLATGGGEYEGTWNSMMEKAPSESLSGTPDRMTVYVTDSEGIYEAWQQAYAEDPSIELLQTGNYWFLIPQ